MSPIGDVDRPRGGGAIVLAAGDLELAPLAPRAVARRLIKRGVAVIHIGPLRTTALSQLAVGEGGLVTALALDGRESDWLRAVGIFEGMHVVLLRRAPFGGPLHVRTSLGAEFAIDRQLAGGIAVEAA